MEQPSEKNLHLKTNSSAQNYQTLSSVEWIRKNKKENREECHVNFKVGLERIKAVSGPHQTLYILEFSVLHSEINTPVLP